MIASALRGTEHELAARIQSDMLGHNGFILWALCIVLIGCLGYIPYFRTTSRYLLALLAVVIVLRNGGVWQNARQALQDASTAGPEPAVAIPETSTTGGSGGSSAGDVIGSVAKLAPLALSFL